MLQGLVFQRSMSNTLVPLGFHFTSLNKAENSAAQKLLSLQQQQIIYCAQDCKDDIN